MPRTTGRPVHRATPRRSPRPSPTPATPETRSARRRTPARLAPAALAGQRGDAREGLAWLGRAPEARASVLYRAVRLLARVILFGVFRFRVDVSGRERIPAKGGYLVVAAAHRGWMDPFVVMQALPPAPRCWFLGSAPSTFTSPLREAVVRRLGGLLPVWRGGVGIEQHVASAQAVLASGAVFVQMPEGTVNGSAGRIAPFRIGAAVIALRTGAPILPIAIAGTEELYLGKRMAASIRVATTALELLGPDAPHGAFAAGSRAELELARTVTARLEAILGPVVEALQPATVDPPDHPRRLRRRLTWLLLRPGPLER
ncbi:MAG TPA: lysophospholipid acyltransferase family protein [Candidatus Limnocylindrales bacterium]